MSLLGYWVKEGMRQLNKEKRKHSDKQQSHGFRLTFLEVDVVLAFSACKLHQTAVASATVLVG